MIKRTIVIDTDPGQDDAVAMLLALASPGELEVAAITAVAGNVPLERTFDNARRLVELADRPEVPVYAGAPRPMFRDLITAEYVHGDTGIDGAVLPEPVVPALDDDAVDVIIDLLRERPPGTVTLCPLGPLTNVAQVMVRAPDVVDRIQEIVLMGGAFYEGGNTTPVAEFNILVDPHAADIVMRSGVPVVMMPLDVTHRALVLPRHLERFAAMGTPVGDAVHGMLDFYQRYDVEKYGIAGVPLHDPCVIAYLLEPSLFSGRHCNVTIETGSPITMGMTVVDWWGMTDREPNCLYMRDVDSDGFFDLLADRIGRL